LHNKFQLLEVGRVIHTLDDSVHEVHGQHFEEIVIVAKSPRQHDQHAIGESFSFEFLSRSNGDQKIGE
jgi:hypothetical protein